MTHALHILARPYALRVALCLGFAGAMLTGAYAQDISINFGQGLGVTERALQMVALLTILSLSNDAKTAIRRQDAAYTGTHNGMIVRHGDTNYTRFRSHIHTNRIFPR